MLLNEFLKAHEGAQEQAATIRQLKDSMAAQREEIRALTTRLDEQAAQLQKVSARLRMSDPAPRLVASD